MEHPPSLPRGAPRRRRSLKSLLSPPAMPWRWPEVMLGTRSQLSVWGRACASFPTVEAWRRVAATAVLRAAEILRYPGPLEAQVSLAPALPCPAGIAAQDLLRACSAQAA